MLESYLYRIFCVLCPPCLDGMHVWISDKMSIKSAQNEMIEE